MLLTIPQEILQAVVNYLATKPYNEVVNIIGAIQKEVKEVEEKEATVETVIEKKAWKDTH